ncbi:hypothetical protein ABBQ32_14215 [Trebouxia sp. C0010 RCD-2024]
MLLKQNEVLNPFSRVSIGDDFCFFFLPHGQQVLASCLTLTHFVRRHCALMHPCALQSSPKACTSSCCQAAESCRAEICFRDCMPLCCCVPSSNAEPQLGTKSLCRVLLPVGAQHHKSMQSLKQTFALRHSLRAAPAGLPAGTCNSQSDCCLQSHL